MNKYDCPRCDGIGRIEIDSPEGDYRTACLKCGSTGKRMVTIPLERYETLKSEIDHLRAERDAAIEELNNAQPCFACAGFERNGGKCSGAGTCRIRDFAEAKGLDYKDHACGESWSWRGLEEQR